MDKNLIIYRKKDTGVYQPKLLPSDDEQNIKQILLYLKQSMGQPYATVKENYPDGLIRTIKYSRALKNMIFRSYFEPKRQLKLPVDLIILRESLFTLVNEKHNGYITTREAQMQILSLLKDEFNLDCTLEELKTFLFSDHQEKQIIQQKDNFPTVRQVMDDFYRELIIAVIKSANKLIFRFKRSLTGKEYRKSHYLGSRSGLYVEFHHISDLKDEAEFEIAVEVTDEVIGRRYIVANRLIGYFIHIFRTYRNILISPPVIKTTYRKRAIEVDLSELKPWFPQKVEKPERELTFDSSTEKVFYSQLKKIPSLYGKLVRDAEIIVVPDGSIIIPDFQINYHGQKLFIEVVGFWTQNYKKRKLYKLNQLSQTWHQKLLLLIDKNLDFPTTPYPSFMYKNNKFPLTEMLEYIEEWQRPIYRNKLSKVKNKLDSQLKPKFEHIKVLTINDFQKIFELASVNEAKKVIDELWGSHLDNILLKLPSNVFITKSQAKKWVNILEGIMDQKDNYPIRKQWLSKKLKSQTDEIKLKWIETLLEWDGYKIQHKDLITILIYPKG